MVYQKEIVLHSDAFDVIYDITDKVQQVVRESQIQMGIVNVFNIGSTASVTTIEFEPGLKKDFPEALDRLIPRDIRYAHDDTWHDGNGHSHVRASLMGPSLTIPFSEGRLVVGTWQQIILVDWDNRPRNRRVFVLCMGE